MARPYKVPIYPVMPSFIALLSLFAAYLYGGLNVQILLPTGVLYAAAALWYWVWARKMVLPFAPEEVAARIAQELARRQGGLADQVPAPCPASPAYVWLERITGLGLVLGLVSVSWILLGAKGVLPVARSESAEVLGTIIVWSALFMSVCRSGLGSSEPMSISLGSTAEPLPFSSPPISISPPSPPFAEPAGAFDRVFVGRAGSVFLDQVGSGHALAHQEVAHNAGARRVGALRIDPAAGVIEDADPRQVGQPLLLVHARADHLAGEAADTQ